MIEVDGGHLEGGGQIIRTAVALSAVTGQATRIFNIRKGRERPGLRPQHLEGISAAARICRARVDALRPNSTEITFEPGMLGGGAFFIDTRTAGSVTLILQTLVLIGICADAPLELTIKGGTAVPFSPTVDYFQHVFCRILRSMGVSINVRLVRHGFYPKGGGEILVQVMPSDLKSLDLLEPGALRRISAFSVASDHLKSALVAERMLEGFARVIKDAEPASGYVNALSPGCFIFACAQYENTVLGADAFGKRGKRAEDVGDEAARNLRTVIDSSSAIDSWMVDQIIPYMALATHRTHQPSRIGIPEMTKHAETNIWVVQKFLPVEFSIENNVMSCRKTS